MVRHYNGHLQGSPSPPLPLRSPACAFVSPPWPFSSQRSAPHAGRRHRPPDRPRPPPCRRSRRRSGTPRSAQVSPPRPRRSSRTPPETSSPADRSSGARRRPRSPPSRRSGLVTAIAAGAATITATSEGQVGTASLTVTVNPVATVTVTLASSTLVQGAGTQATATLRDGSGNTLTGRPVTWSSASIGVASVTSTGVVTAVSPGAVLITATSEGKSGSATLTVNALTVSTVTVSVSSPLVGIGKLSQAGCGGEGRERGRPLRSRTWPGRRPRPPWRASRPPAWSPAWGSAPRPSRPPPAGSRARPRSP